MNAHPTNADDSNKGDVNTDTAAKLSHFDPASGRAQMVDVGAKMPTSREAVAEGYVIISPRLHQVLQEATLEKGDAFTVAKVAGIMAAKQTGLLIPLCHPLPLDLVDVALTLQADGRLRIEGRARTQARTGVEMEALTAVSVAALAFYDMCKAVDKTMRIEGICLLRKSGGKSSFERGEHV